MVVRYACIDDAKVVLMQMHMEIRGRYVQG